MLTAGIDIGSRSSKAVIMDNGKVISTAISLESHLSVADRGLKVLEEALIKTSFKQKDLNAIIATGYGRISAPYATDTVTEITCHAKGVFALLPGVKTIIDIGGQDSKVIKLNNSGEIVDFTMNDRCAAGTGKFLEVTAKALNLDLNEFSELYFESKKPCKISSMCTVFAESEVISLLADNISKKDIAAGLIQAVAIRVGNMAKRLKVEADLAFTGGVAKNSGVKKALEEVVGEKFTDFNFDPQLVGAFGAAVIAANQKKTVEKNKNEELATGLRLEKLLSNRQKEVEELKKKGEKTLGYFCSYVPEEIVRAFGITPFRLIRGGDAEASNIGNNYLSSNSCPFAASCIGLKEKGTDFYFSNMDIIADAPSCYQMKRVLEVWEKYFNTKVIHIALPRNFYQKAGLDYFTVSLSEFIEQLEKETGEKLNKKKLEEIINVYNEIRKKQRKLYSFLRSNKIRWKDLIKFIHAGFVLDYEDYLNILNELIDEIETSNIALKELPVRILLTGGMAAPGDNKLINIFEDLGIDFAMDELCAGSRNTLREIESPDIAGIAKAYLYNVPCGALPYPFEESDPRILHLKKLIEEHKIDGILYYTLRFCDAYSYKTKQIKDFCNSMNILYLHLHSDFSTSDEGQVKTRIEAFVESLKGQRK
ncbi:2-hydroxyacyl-CoA dehydratase [Candidatus Poribacteria bacterium]|nr:2-hydroxyacyl-CoA dehydratase [Candidatus Poribacteria bacterium]